MATPQGFNSPGGIPLGPGVSVAKQADGLYALDKPAGIRSHPNRPGADGKSLLTAPYDLDGEFYQWDDAAGKAQRLYLLNRLDAPTSGLILLADNEAEAKRIKDLFAAHKVEKTYYAIVKGNYAGRRETWRDRLSTSARGGAVRTVVGRGDPAVTHVRGLGVLTRTSTLTLLELRPETGRTHQLRVQCAHRNMPIVGDATYGDFRFNRQIATELGEKRLMLHAGRMCIPGKNSFSVEIASPEVFKVFLH